MNAEYQQKAIERLKEKTSATIRKALGFMLTSDFAAVSAKLEDVSKRKAINARLTIPSNAMFRHQLFDAQGQHVLVVLADPAQWLTRMDEIKARGDQLDLFNPDANYDPERDQPGYRRDRDPLAPGKTWDELKKDLGVTDAGAIVPPPPPAAAPPPDTTQPSLTPAQEHEASLRELQERLERIGVTVSLGTLSTRSDADIIAAALWLSWYESSDNETPVERPTWLPVPSNNDSED